ncbi:hypothetical protein [Pontibacter liquoris]|uniref:hypothetical protein n=1 Tax=Pontibacter liquoris TaxID=2905677 RepID=UPI001FA7B502|nr:hypothetical protein [Pontibacter liquoris]
MKRQHRAEDNNWYGRKADREQGHERSLPHHHLQHTRRFTVPGHFRDSEKEAGNLTFPVQKPATGSSMRAPAEALSSIKQLHGPSNAYFTYNAGGGENRKYTVNAGHIIKKAGNDTGTNIYLGGRTSCYGPAGFGAVQKQYGFARYNAGSKKEEGPESHNAN